MGSFAEFIKSHRTPEQEEGKLRIQAGARYKDWLAENDLALTSFGSGTFIAASTRVPTDLENVEFIHEMATAHGAAAEWVSEGNVPGYRPHAAHRAARILHLPDEAYLDARELMESLYVRLSAMPTVRFIDGGARKIEGGPGGWRVELESGDSFSAGVLVLACGAHLTTVAPWLVEELKLPRMIGGRGTSAVVNSTEIRSVIRTPNRHFACGTHAVPLPGGRTYIGATNRLMVQPNRVVQPTVGEVHTLFDGVAHDISTRLRTAEVEVVRAGLRPIAADGFPLIGAAGPEGLFLASGTYRNGMLLAPEVARRVADQIESPTTAPDFFSPMHRPWNLDEGEATRRLIGGVGSMLGFLQEPGGFLPYEREDELRRFIERLLDAATSSQAHEGLKAEVEATLAAYPMKEALPLLLYQLAE